MDKPELQWIQDSAGVTSCHVNDGSLNFQQSLIGTLNYRSDGWHVILKDNTDITPAEGCPSLARARMCLETHSQKKNKKPIADRIAPRVAQTGRV